MPHTSDGAAAAAAANRRGGTKRKRSGDHNHDPSTSSIDELDASASLPIMSPDASNPAAGSGDGDATMLDADRTASTAAAAAKRPSAQAASASASNKRPRFAMATSTKSSPKTSGSGSDSGNSSGAGGQSSSSTGNEGEASNSASSTTGTTSTSVSDRGGASTSSGNPAVVTASVGDSGATTTSTSGRSLSGGGSSGGISGSGSGGGSGSGSEDRSTSARSRSSGDDERQEEDDGANQAQGAKKVVKISGMSELGKESVASAATEQNVNVGTANKSAEAMIVPESERKLPSMEAIPASAKASNKILPGSSGLHHHRHHHAKMGAPSQQISPSTKSGHVTSTATSSAHPKSMSATAPNTNANTKISSTTSTSSSMGPPPQSSDLLPAGSSIEPNRVTASGHATVVASSTLPGPPTNVAPPPAVTAATQSQSSASASTAAAAAVAKIPGGPIRAEDSVASSLSVSMPSGSGSGSGSDEMSGAGGAGGTGGAKTTSAGAKSGSSDPFSLPHKLPPPAEQGGSSSNNNNNHGGVNGGSFGADDSSSSAVSGGIIRDNPMSVTAEGLPNPPSEVKGAASSSSDRSRAQQQQQQQHRRHHHHSHHNHADSGAGAGGLTPVVPATKMGPDATVEAATDAKKKDTASTTTAAAAVAAPAKLRRSASNSADDMNDDSNSSSNSGSEGGYEGSSSSNAETREGSCSSPSVSSSEASGGSGERVMAKKRGGGGTGGGQASAQAGPQRSSSLLGPPPPEIPPQPLRPARSTATSSSSTSSTMSSGENIMAGGAAASGGALPSVSGVTGKDFTFRARDSARDSKSSSLSLSSSSMEPPSRPAAEAPAAAAARAAQGGGSTDDLGFKMDESFKRKIERACSAQNDRRRRQLQLMSLDRHGMKSDRRKRKDSHTIGPTMAAAKGEPGDSSSLSDEPGRKKPRAKMPVSIPPVMGPCAMDWEAAVAPVPDLSTIWQKSPIYCIGTDNMACVLAFLEPPEVHSVLTMPLSKTWRSVFTAPQELWKVLCLEAPFFAKIDDAPFGDSDSENSSLCSFPMCTDTDSRHIFGRYRLLYTSFVRCMRYLARIKDDAVNGRAPSALDDVAGLAPNLPFNGNASLKDFFHKARGIIQSKRRRDSGDTSSSESSISSSDVSVTRPNEQETASGPPAAAAAAAAAAPTSEIRTMDDGSSIASSAQSTEPPRKTKKKAKTQRYGDSKLTKKLLGPSIENGIGGPVELPWSCAIYSVVNWMVAFADVEGIQVMCLKVLPCLLEDEKQRTTAQRAGLTDIVLRAMVLFPDSVEVHTAAFHTLVLLARPLGGHEGDLFHSAMLNASGIFNVGTNTGRNGIAIMLDSMRRFANQEVLQAMSCWSMVNIALIPKQKTMLVKLGGISVVANAMMQHPFNAEVQFRALFALINLVIPSENLADEQAVDAAAEEELGVAVDVTERDMLDENVGQISNLVVVAMKNFCSSEAILNRACLVLHNLSLNEEYHRSLLWTPNCYQMLEWCIGNYRHDQVLQQSAGGTLQRLQMTLANDADLRMRFLETIRAQQQSQLEQVRREAMAMGEAAAAAADARPQAAS